MADLIKQFDRWNVRILRCGDRYGLNDCLTYNNEKPVIEFYDTRYINKEWQWGQFVSRYYAKTLFEDEWNLHHNGLQLDGGVPEWYVFPQILAEIFRWLRQELPQFKPTARQLSDWNFKRKMQDHEADRIQNALARAIIRKVRSNGGGKCYLGKYNRNPNDPFGLQEYRYGMIYNFQYDFVIPAFDQQIQDWLLEYQTHSGQFSLIEKIGKRVYELEGCITFWS